MDGGRQVADGRVRSQCMLVTVSSACTPQLSCFLLGGSCSRLHPPPDSPASGQRAAGAASQPGVRDGEGSQAMSATHREGEERDTRRSRICSTSESQLLCWPVCRYRCSSAGKNRRAKWSRSVEVVARSGGRRQRSGSHDEEERRAQYKKPALSSTVQTASYGQSTYMLHR